MSGTAPRVLHVVESWSPIPSGYASRSRWIVEGQLRTGTAVPAVLVTSRQGVYGEAEATPLDGVPIELRPPSAVERTLRGGRVPGLHRPWHVDGAALRAGIVDAARRHRAELVHVHWASAIGMAAARAAHRLGIPLVAELRFDLAGAMRAQDAGGRAGPVESLARRWFDRHLSHATTIVAASDALGAFVSARLPRRADDIVVVPNGIDASFLDACDRARASVVPHAAGEPRRPVIGTTSRMLRYEGLETLLAAAHELPDVDWLFVGDGPEREALERLAAPLVAARPGRVAFTGRVPAERIPALLAGMDVFAVPRLALSITRHASPIKVVEAMACARAVVATDVGDIGSLLTDGCGVVVPPGDPASFVEALRRAAHEPALRATLGTAARTRISDRYRGDELIRRYRTAYARALRVPVRSGAVSDSGSLQ